MPELGYKRAERVGQLLQQELGRLLVGGVNDPRVGFVTVTEVRLSDDLRSARAYVSIYGTEEQRAESLHGLRDAAGYLRREIGRRVHLKYIPTLSFCLDTTLDHAERLDAVLAAAAAGEEPPGELAPSTLVPIHTHRSDLADSAAVLAQHAPKKAPDRKRRGVSGNRKARKRK